MSLDLGKEGKGFTKEEMVELSLEDLGAWSWLQRGLQSRLHACMLSHSVVSNCLHRHGL